MNPLTVSIACLVLLSTSAIGAMLTGARSRSTVAIGSIGGSVAGSLGVIASGYALLSGRTTSLYIPWTLPMGAFHLRIDGLSAFFLLCLFLVSGINSAYAAGYLLSHHDERPVTAQVAFHNLLLASMAMLVLARDGLLFIMAWEVMSLTSFFLVATDHDDEQVRHAGYFYLAASHLGTVCLFLVFALLARKTGSFDFDVWTATPGVTGQLASVCFVLSVVGFGTKAGFWPTHVWLPYAHPAAPSPVSALMSGVMIKMGIYGLLRTLQFLGPPLAWWGQALIAIGMVSGVLGVLLALAQHDLKRLLAYHSVENIGIIAIGIGTGLVGRSQGQPLLAFFGFAGALLHVLNHALFKSLLFQAAGNIALATGERNVQALGGLARRLPLTSVLFLVGSVAICGLPPFNGFVSEWLIYVGAFRGAATLAAPHAASSVAALFALALIGGLALACFVKAFGVVFLGEPRSESVLRARELPALMTGPMLISAALCAMIGTWPILALRLLQPAVREMSGLASLPVDAVSMLVSLTRVVAGLLVLALGLALLRHVLLRGRAVTRASTWGCGYPAPTPRMQYSAGSFAAPLLFVFRPLLGARTHQVPLQSYFQREASSEEHFSDLAASGLVLPASRALLRAAARLKVLQHGRVQLYLVYVFVTLVGLLLWQLSAAGG